jgi:murein DD-endopeptidase MepM/ murein hydrolase activator NlpD
MSNGRSPVGGPEKFRSRGGNVWLLLLTLLCAALTDPLPARAAAPRPILRLAPEQVKQGGVTVLSIESSAPIRSLRIRVGDREIRPGTPDGRNRVVLVIGIDLEQPPSSVPVRADVVDGDGQRVSGQRALRILDARFPVQRLTVPRPFVELDAPTLERVGREKEVLDRLWGTVTPDRLWRGPFRVPLDGAGPASGFGVRRIINGEPRAPHTGVDFSMPAGAPVLAANAGIVALVADQFFSGTSVILDHGLGLYTMYFHLQESLVQPGQRVDAGQMIARVGSTGRATGPHLHWGARLYGARIDPEGLLRPFSLE